MSNQLGYYNRFKDITKSDTVDINADGSLTDSVFVGGAGDVIAVQQDGTTNKFTCVAGQLLPIRIRRVNSTNTTATVMVALFEA